MTKYDVAGRPGFPVPGKATSYITLRNDEGKGDSFLQISPGRRLLVPRKNLMM